MRCPWMVRPRGVHVALLVVGLAGACGKGGDPPPATATHAPVSLAPAQQQMIARFVGTWAHAGGEAEQAAALEAVGRVTAPMNGLIRGLAESRLEALCQIAPTVDIAVSDGIVTITRGGHPRPFVAPADGKPFEMTTEQGDAATGSLRVDGDTIVTRVETEKGGGERIYRIDPQGQLEIAARTFSPQLPTDLEYSMHYRRP